MLASFSNILYATDLSDNSMNAFRHAVSLAKQTKSEIHILHVVEALSNEAKTTLMMFVMDDKLRNDAMSNRTATARKMLDDAQDDFWSGVDDEDKQLRDHIKSIEVMEAYPAEAILNQAEKLSCDLIILGGHAQGISHTFLGSIAKRVLRRTRIPTLIIPAKS